MHWKHVCARHLLGLRKSCSFPDYMDKLSLQGRETSTSRTPTTFSTMPPAYRDLGPIHLQPGNFYNLSSIPCRVGPISSTIFTSDSTFYYQQDSSGPYPKGS